MIKVKTNDGSYTLKSDKFNECYHSSEGAVKESLYKHIYPAFSVIQKKEINILDICFGLGYNTFLTVLNRPENTKLNIFSPEMDEDLVKNLKNFPYPKEFEGIRNIIEKISNNFYYEDEMTKIEIFIGNAREYIKTLSNIDIVYQDAFSPKVNRELWTIDYFTQIKNILNKNGIITTYTVATPVRCALYKLGFKLYTHSTDKIRKGTIASLTDLPFERVNFEEKLKRINCYYYKDEKN